MILAATRNRCQLDQVEQAMKMKFPDDELRHHDDRTGKYHNNILGDAVDEEDDQLSRAEEERENNVVALVAAQEKVEALVSLATANRKIREARDKQHQVRMSRGYSPQQESQRDGSTKRPERKCVICNGPHWASQRPEKPGKPGEKKG